jgi:hypothetical protein
MAAWDTTSAVANLRSLLGDGRADKYEFMADVVPTPNGLVTRFFCGRTRLAATPTIYLGGVLTSAASGSVDLDTGTFGLEPAPTGTVQASFYYQWFADPELAAFLTEAALLLRYTGLDDAALPEGVRPIVGEFACYYAYRRKAGEWAESVVASAGGYTADQSRPAPNWRALADAAWKNATEKLKLYVDNPLTGAQAPAMRFVAYSLPTYTPLS